MGLGHRKANERLKGWWVRRLNLDIGWCKLQSFPNFSRRTMTNTSSCILHETEFSRWVNDNVILALVFWWNESRTGTSTVICGHFRLSLGSSLSWCSTQHVLMRWASPWATDKNCNIKVQRACGISSEGQLIFWLHDEFLILCLNFLDSLAFASSFLVWLHNLDHFLSTPNSLLVSSLCTNRHFLSSWFNYFCINIPLHDS